MNGRNGVKCNDNKRIGDDMNEGERQIGCLDTGARGRARLARRPRSTTRVSRDQDVRRGIDEDGTHSGQLTMQQPHELDDRLFRIASSG